VHLTARWAPGVATVAMIFVIALYMILTSVPA
jgi:hypothetical protein